MIDFRFGTAFRNNLTDEEEAAMDHLLDMMTAIKQQILLRRAMKRETYSNEEKHMWDPEKDACEYCFDCKCFLDDYQNCQGDVEPCFEFLPKTSSKLKKVDIEVDNRRD